MIRRLLSFVLLIWALGFVWFALFLPQPAPAERSDGVIVLTGGTGRIDRGLELLRAGQTRQMLVSGVDREVRPIEFAAQFKVEPELMRCCVTLGFEATDTRSNGREAARWMAEHKLRTVRVVTTDWHMRRAAYEIELARPEGVRIIRDSVKSKPSLRILAVEYHKLLARHLGQLLGV